ncbi:lamin tail domain-containing protein [Actinoplanes sp. NPDC049118]|uniref:lamin tail domain-containing protein n=1 Tax=Actinoplanes sp. NPDC049118 TaxID=3155769 RepID=UPI0033FE197F
MRARITAIFTTIGCVAALGLTAPAAAADAAPTISAPASRNGFGPITITGKAPAGATVELYESAYIFNDFYPAPVFGTGGYVTTTASSSGSYTLTRMVDSGFRFYVKANGVESNRITVAMGIIPTMTMTASNGTVGVDVAADPAQPGLRVHVQRNDSGAWTDVAGGYTSDPAAVFTTTLNGQGSGTKTYRAVIDADTDNNLLAGQTTSISLNVGNGTGGGTGGGTTPTPNPTPTTPTPTPKPTTPAPKPTTPAPKAGDVQFSKIVYNSPGKDTGSNTSLNAEYVRLLNKTKATINLKGWTIRDAAGHVYTVNTDQRVAAGKYVYLHTGKGTNGKPDSRHRYWNRTGYVWNNGGDTAYLRTSSGKSIDSCKWTSGKGQTYC